jgi:alkaline phosphatase
VEEARASIRQRREHSGGHGRARNVIMFLGDGMSVPTLAAARALLGQRSQHPGEEAHLSFEQFPAVGLAKVMEELS